MLPPVLERLPQLDVVRCYFEPDGTFPNHEPNPLLPENREFIVAKVARGERRPRRRVRRRRRPLLLRRRHGRVRPRRLRHRAARRGRAREGAGREGDLRRARELGRARDDRAAGGIPLVNRVGHAFIKQRMRKEDAVFAGEVSAHYYFRDFSQADTGVVPFLLMLELLSRSGTALSELLAPVPRALLPHRRDQHAGRRRAAEAPGAEGALRGRGRAHLAPRRDLDRLRRLALQRPAVEHRAAAAPEPRGALRGADGREAGRGARSSSAPRRRPSRRARPRHRPPAAVQVLGAGTRLVLGHGRAGRRLLRPLPAVLRPRAHRVPPPSRRRSRAGARVRDARVGGRVPRAGTLRRPHRGLRARAADRTHEHDLRVRRVSAARRRAHGHGASRPSCSSTSTTRRPTPVPDELRATIGASRAATSRSERRARSRRSTASSTERRTPTTSSARPSSALVGRARHRLGGHRVHRGRTTLVLGPVAGDPDEARRDARSDRLPGRDVGELWVDGEPDPRVLEQVADPRRAARPHRLGHGRRGLGAVEHAAATDRGR